MGLLYLLSRGSVACKRGERIVVEKEGEIVCRMPMRAVEAVVIGQQAQITTQAVFALIERQKSIFYMDGKGNPVGEIRNARQSAGRLLAQVDLFRDEKRQAEMAREIVHEKIWNQYRLVRKYGRIQKSGALMDAARTIRAYQKTIATIADVPGLRGVEGIAARAYFDCFPLLLDQSLWPWHGRTRRPARDPVNALLNYGYAFLEREVRLAVGLAGMDGRIGFFHANDGRKDSLVFDLMELFRQPVVDRLVLDILHRHSLKPEQFSCGEEGCFLDVESRRLWCGRYEVYMNKAFHEYRGKTVREMIVARVRSFAEKYLDGARTGE